MERIEKRRIGLARASRMQVAHSGKNAVGHSRHVHAARVLTQRGKHAHHAPQERVAKQVFRRTRLHGRRSVDFRKKSAEVVSRRPGLVSFSQSFTSRVVAPRQSPPGPHVVGIGFKFGLCQRKGFVKAALLAQTGDFE